MPTQSPPPAQPWIREEVAPAPYLDAHDRCSDCNVRPMPARDGMRVCPNCYALLQHPDYGRAERERKAQLNQQHAAEERVRRDARRLAQAVIKQDRLRIRQQLQNDALQRTDDALRRAQQIGAAPAADNEEPR